MKWLRRFRWLIERDLPRLRSLESVAHYHTMVTLDQYLHTLRSQPRYREPLRLLGHESQSFSQHGEDGAIAEILRRIGVEHKTFFEIGAGDGLENNTAFLLLQGWSGWWVEKNASPAFCASCQRHVGSGHLKIIADEVREDNFQRLIKAANVPASVDVLSLDIDRHTYWLWKWCREIRSRVVVVEYNPCFPPPIEWVAEYAPERSWNGSVYYGASLAALEKLGTELGYSLVGCDVSGTNAYFVRADLCSEEKFAAPFSAANHYEPARYYFAHRWGGSHRRGLDG